MRRQRKPACTLLERRYDRDDEFGVVELATMRSRVDGDRSVPIEGGRVASSAASRSIRLSRE